MSEINTEIIGDMSFSLYLCGKIADDMRRDGNGDAWKYRQMRPHGQSGVPRHYAPRTLKPAAQLGLDDVYITPQRQKRRYSEYVYVSYVEVERQTQPTGIRIFDDYLLYFSKGDSEMYSFADRRGVKRENIDSLAFVLTGMRGVDFRMAFQVRMSDELLRYTDLRLDEINRHADFGSANNLYLTYKSDFNIALANVGRN